MQRLGVSVTVSTLAVLGVVWLGGGCKQEGKAVGGSDLNVLLNSGSPSDRLKASKRLAAQGEVVLPGLLEAFSKAEGKPDAQGALAETVFRMAPTDATVAALEKMAEQAKDPGVKGRIAGFAQQRKMKR
jgi:hypothetical protein